MAGIVIVADDLTGAADTGIRFRQAFPEILLASHGMLDRALAECPEGGLAIHTESRHLDERGARDRIRKTAAGLVRHGIPRFLYKKIDSCLRGNVGAEMEALVDGLGYRASFVVPAFPEQGRTTRHGIHYVHGIPVSESEPGQDPLNPVGDSRIIGLLEGQCRLSFGHVDMEAVEAGEPDLYRIVGRLLASGVSHIVFDAAEVRHLDRIARLILRLNERILPVGSAGLAGAISRLLPARPGHEGRPYGRRDGHLLLVCGTRSPVTRRQIETLEAECPYVLEEIGAAVLADPERKSEFDRRVEKGRERLTAGHLIIAVSDAGESGQPWPAKAVASGLGRFVKELVETATPAGLFLTGGDTAGCVLEWIDAAGLLLEKELMPGIVAGTVRGGRFQGLPVVTKAGAFGSPDALVSLHRGGWGRLMIHLPSSQRKR